MTVARARAAKAAGKAGKSARPVSKKAVAKAAAAPVSKKSVAKAAARRPADVTAASPRSGVTVRSLGGPHAVRSTQVRVMASSMLRELGRPGAELSVMLVDDHRIQELNRDWRHIDRPTDVLSFPMQEGDFGSVNPSMLGDIVISIPTAERQAKVAGRGLEQEVAMLLAHGLLHLLGFDHDTRAKEKIMVRETDRLIAVASAG